jgi:hypothetical protein
LPENLECLFYLPVTTLLVFLFTSGQNNDTIPAVQSCYQLENQPVKARAIPPTLCLCYCFAVSGCAPFPGRVAASLKGPQPRNGLVGPATETGGGSREMIVWNTPDLNDGTWMFSSNYSQDDVDRSLNLCGPTGMLFGEWKDVEGKRSQDVARMRLIHGWAAASQFAGSDFGGTHRYRDWNILLVGGDGFEQFAAPANDPTFTDWPEVQDLYVQNPELGRLIEVEWDSGFFAPEMAPQTGDETMVVGRWDFDCGHGSATKSGEVKSTGFRSEMHAPAILISAHVVKTEPASVQTRYKIFAGSRSGPLDTVPLLFFFQRLWGTHINPLGAQDYSVALRAPQDGWRIASCTSEDGTKPGGRFKKIDTQLQPSDAGKSLTLQLLAKTFNSGARVGRSMTVNAVWVPENSPGREGAVKCE